MIFLNQVRVAGVSVPAAASGSTPARMTRDACRNSIKIACAALMRIAMRPRTTTTAGAAPVKLSRVFSREANWPPVEALSTQSDQASPAWSSRSGSSTPTAEVAAMMTRPDPTSMRGLALRVRAILPPAMIRPSTATAAASGSIHC